MAAYVVALPPSSYSQSLFLRFFMAPALATCKAVQYFDVRQGWKNKINIPGASWVWPIKQGQEAAFIALISYL
jgi:hypothetical protein